MATKDKDTKTPDTKDDEIFPEVDISPFVGGEGNDDVMSMEYPTDETDIIETMPPETKEEADLLRAAKAEEGNESETDDDDTDSTAVDNDSDSDDDGDSDGGSSDDNSDDDTNSDDDDGTDDDTDDDASDSDDSGDKRIPHARFNKVVEERNELRAKLAKLEEGTKEEADDTVIEPTDIEKELNELNGYDFDAREDEYMDAVNEGEKETARAIRKEIREKEQRISELKAQEIVSNVTGAQNEEAAFTTVAEELEAEYPILDNSSADFNADLQAETIELFQGFALSGNYSKIDALRKATKMMAKMHSWDKDSGDTKPKLKDKEVKPDIKKKVAANNKQPPHTKQTEGEEVTTAQVIELSEEEFSALPEDMKRRMRGDFVAV